jgi:hypothetical protein
LARNDPQFQPGVIALEFGKARDQPSHCEGRQSRYPQQPRGWHGLAQALRHRRQAIERRARFGEQRRPHLRRRRISAGAQKQSCRANPPAGEPAG